MISSMRGSNGLGNVDKSMISQNKTSLSVNESTFEASSNKDDPYYCNSSTYTPENGTRFVPKSELSKKVSFIQKFHIFLEKV
jgi:hypothetical protein